MDQNPVDRRPPPCAEPPEPACRQELDRILESDVLSGSQTLRALLKLLFERSIGHPAEGLKAADIAAEIFGRSEYDSNFDSIVRVHVGRLRSKLAEHYVGAGANDPVVFDVPKGHYRIVARFRVPGAGATPAASPPPATTPKRTWDRRSAAIHLAFAAAGAAIAWLFALWYFPSAGSPPPAPLATFWRDYVNDAEEPLVVFSNPLLVGSHITGMRYFRSGEDEGKPVIDSYTGVSEVYATHRIASTMFLFHKSIRLQRGRQMLLEEGKLRNVVFIGGVAANAPVGALLALKYFDWKDPASEPGLGRWAIVSKEPGAAVRYFFGPDTRPYQFDYALVALVPGLAPSRRALLLGGTTTIGTQAAAEFVCNPSLVADLLAKLGVQPGRRVPDFEALIQAKAFNGLPTDIQAVAVRPRDGSK